MKTSSVANGLTNLAFSQESRFKWHALMPSSISSRVARNKKEVCKLNTSSNFTFSLSEQSFKNSVCYSWFEITFTMIFGGNYTNNLYKINHIHIFIQVNIFVLVIVFLMKSFSILFKIDKFFNVSVFLLSFNYSNLLKIKYYIILW